MEGEREKSESEEKEHELSQLPLPHACTHLEVHPLARVEDEELLQEVFTVRGHVEGDAVLASQHPLPQLLQAQQTRETSHDIM